MKLENLSALFENGAYTLVLQKDGETIYKDFGRGVGPALRVYDTQPELLRGAEVCDTIVGKAAAAIYILAGASGVYAETMSAAAVDFLTANGVACARLSRPCWSCRSPRTACPSSARRSRG